MVDVFEEVEEELRSERYRRLFRTWAPWVAGALVLALVAALAWWGWQSWQDSRADEASVAYDRGMQAMGEQNLEAADAAFEEAADVGTAGYKALALQQRAGIAVAQERIEDAVALFDEAARASRQPLLADLANLKAAFLLMDTASLEGIEARLAPLAADGRPYASFAREAQGLARLQHGQSAEARPVFALLSLGQDVPDVVRERAQLALDAIDSGVAASIPDILRAQAASTGPQDAQTATPASGGAEGGASPPQP